LASETPGLDDLNELADRGLPGVALLLLGLDRGLGGVVGGQMLGVGHAPGRLGDLDLQKVRVRQAQLHLVGHAVGQEGGEPLLELGVRVRDVVRHF